MPDEISAATALPKAAIEQAQRAQSPAEAVFWIVAACALGALGLLGFLVYKRATSPAPSVPGITREEVKALLLETLAKPAAPSDSQQTRALLIRATAAIEGLPALIAKTLTDQAQEAANKALTDAANDLRATAQTLRDAQAQEPQSPTTKGGTNAGRKRPGG